MAYSRRASLDPTRAKTIEKRIRLGTVGNECAARYIFALSLGAGSIIKWLR
ncbi:hypothetical protein SynBIOSU31_01697 [Synechococcus sp. BIOS-U3-1]|nr:hypothetical protein SynBIOSU31_01697 [Synechococcus sp. BIOS-U3-1]